ncbi:MAG: hypothetical protein NUV80_00810 [Candidatus Berkelbacteria bacterium]|nr:hypothetical protein [Candidatus Berkelbacteria bacterium]
MSKQTQTKKVKAWLVVDRKGNIWEIEFSKPIADLLAKGTKFKTTPCLITYQVPIKTNKGKKKV